MYDLALFALVILLISITVFLHEYAHAVAAWLFKLKVDIIKVGFGHTVFSTKTTMTSYEIGLIPLGGYTKLDESEFEHAAMYKRIIIWLAGPFSHVLTAIACMSIALILKLPYYPLSITYMHEQAPADVISINNKKTNRTTDLYAAIFANINDSLKIKTTAFSIEIPLDQLKIDRSDVDLLSALNIKPHPPRHTVYIHKQGQEIIALDGVAIKGITDINQYLKNKIGAMVTITYKRGNNTVDERIGVTYTWGQGWQIKPQLDAKIIVKPDGPPLYYPTNLTIKTVMSECMQVLSYQLNILYAIVSGRVDWHVLTGPAGFIQTLMLIIQSSKMSMILYGLASLNLWLLIFNLLPIPPLDGGRALLEILYTPKRYVALLCQLGMIAIVTIITVLTISETFYILSQWHQVW